MSDAENFTIFEAINEPLREIYVGATTSPIFELTARLRQNPPRSIAHWELADINVRSIEFGLGEEAAREFIATYVRGTLPKGWHYLS